MAYGNRVYSYILKFDADVSGVRRQVQDALNSLNDITKLEGGVSYNSSIRDAATSAQILGKNLKEAFNVDTQKLDLTKFTRSIKAGEFDIKSLGTALTSLGPQGEQAFLKVAMAISRAEAPTMQLNGMLDRLWVTMKNTMRWQLTSSMLHGFIGSVQTAWRYTQDLDESLNAIRIVTGKSSEEMAQFAIEANKAAQALNTTTVDYTDASLIYYQQGLDAEKVKERTRITIDAANAAGTSAEQMSEYLTAVWNSYQVATDQLESYVDKMAAVGANTATSLEEISTAMVNVASTANTVGVSMDQLTAIISTVASTTRQSATTIGTAYKTIFARMGDLKLGETLEDGLELGTVSKQLQSIGVNILDVNGDLREMGAVVEEIGEKWQSWTTAQQTAVAQAIAGKRQYTQLIALFDNWDAYQNALSISENSEGTLAKQAETFAEGWEAARRRVDSAVEGVYDSIINPKTMIKFDNVLTSVLNRIENIVDAIGGLGGITTTVVATMSTLYKDKFVNSLRSAYDGIMQLSTAQKEANMKMRQDLIDMVSNIGDGGRELDYMKQRVSYQLQYDTLRRNMTQSQQEAVEREFSLLDYTQQRTIALGDQLQVLDDELTKYEAMFIQIKRIRNAEKESAMNLIGRYGNNMIGANVKNNTLQMNQKDAQNFLAGKLKDSDKSLTDDEALGKALRLMQIYEKKTAETIMQTRKALGSVIEAQNALNGLKEKEGVEITQNTKLTDDQAKAMNRVLTAMSTDTKFAGNVQFFNQFRNSKQEIDVTGMAVADLEKKLADLQVTLQGTAAAAEKNFPHWSMTAEQAQNFSTTCEQLGMKLIQVAEGEYTVELASDRTAEALRRGAIAATDWANKIVAGTQMISTSMMALRSLTNISNLINDALNGNKVSVDQFTMAVTSLIMAMPLLTMVTKKLVASIGLETATIEVATLAENKNILAKGIHLVATKLLHKETIALNVALGTTAAFLGGLVVAALAVVAVFRYIAGETDRANNAIKEAGEVAKETTNELESLQSELEQVKNRIEELEAKDTLDLIEKEELEELHEAESSLERQVALKEKLNNINLVNEAREIEDNFHKGSKNLRNGPDGFESKRYMSYHPWQGDELEAYYKEQFATLKEEIRELYDDFEEIPFEETFEFKDLQYRQSESQMNNWLNDYIDIDEWWNSLSEVEKAQDSYIQIHEEWLKDNQRLKEEWQGENLEDYEAKEEEYLRYIDAVQKGLIERNDTFIKQAQEDLATMRSNFLSDAEIIKLNIDPIFEEEEFQNELTTILGKAFKGQSFDISDELFNKLERYGFSVEQFADIVETRVNKLKENLQGLMPEKDLEEFIQSLDLSDLELLFTMNFTNIDTFEEFYKKFLELKAGVTVSIDFDIARETAREALSTIADGEFLDDETIQKLRDQFAQIYDFSNLEDLSLYDQARSIGQALVIASDPQELYNKQLDESKEKLEKITDELKKQKNFMDEVDSSGRRFMGKGFWDEKSEARYQEARKKIKELSKEEIEIQVDITEAEKKLGELEDMSEIEISLEVDSSMIDAVVGQMGAIEKAASLIGEGFKVEAENVETLMKTLPQLFEDATIDVETGMVQLQQSIVEKVAETAREEVNLTAEGLRERLTNRYNAIQGEIDLLNQVKDNAFKAGQSEVTSAQAFNNMEHENKVKVVQAIIKARMQQAIQERSQSAQSASNSIQDQNKVREASELQGSQVAENWRKTAEFAAKAFREFAIAAVQDQKDIAEGKSPTGKFNLPSLGTVGFSSNASELSWNYDTSAGNQFSAVNKFLDNDLNLWGNELQENSLAESVSEQLAILGFDLDPDIIKRGSEAVIDDFISSNYATWDDFVQDIDASLNDKYYELGITANDLSKLLAGIGNSDILAHSGDPEEKKPKSTKEKGPKEDKGSELDPKEVEERYHEINKLIEEQERLLGDVQTQIDRTYGTSKLREYNKEQQKLNDLIQSQTTKMEEAKGWAEKDLADIKNLGLNPEISDDGRLLNYTQLLQQAASEYNAFVQEWNSHQNEILMPDENGEYGQSWQDQHEQEKKQLEELYNDRLEALKKFEESVKTYWDEFEKREQYYRDLEDNKLKKIAYVLEFQIDYKDAKKDVRDLSKTIEEAFGDALTHGMKTAILDYQNMLDEKAMKPIYDQNFNELLAKIDESKTNKYIDQEELANQLTNLRDNVIASAEAMIEWAESIEDIVPDAIDAARERFDQFTDQLEHNTSIIDTIKEIMVLQGLTLKTAQGYRDIRDMYNKRMDATLAQAKLNRQWYDNALKELQVAQTALDGATEGTEEYDILKANRDALLAEFKDSQAAMLESAKETMETAREMYIDGVERTVYELEQILTKGDGFDLLQDKYDHYIDTEERYLDTVNKIYETTKLNNKLQEQIDKSTNSAHTKRLKELQEEFQEREKNNKLSEYDIEIMNAKLAMLTKQMELEEAVNNKSTLRMVRNSRGNYDYQFTANPDELNSINQEYLDAAQEYYNIAKNKVKEVSGEIIDTWQEMTEKIKDIYEDETLTVDEREARIAEIREYYTQKVKDLESEKQKAILDMTEAGNIAIDDFREAHKDALDGMAGDVGNFRDIFSDDLASILENTDNFNNVFAEDMDSFSEEVERFEELFDQTIDEMNGHMDEFNQKMDEVNDEVGTSYDDLKGILDQVADSTQEVSNRGQENIQIMWDQISAAQNLSMEYARVADEIINLTQRYRDLAHAINEAQFNRLGQITDATYTNPEFFEQKFDKNTDYSAMMSKYLQEGGSMDTIEWAQMLAERDLKIEWLKTQGKDESYWGTQGTDTQNKFSDLVAGKGDQGWYNVAAGVYNDEEYERWMTEWLRKNISSFATGGYTGDFDNGKLAILHEKELILNEDDTKNILDTVDAVRSIDTSVWFNIAHALDSSVALLKGMLINKFSPVAKIEREKETLEQKVEIRAEFPNVTNSNEIEEALSHIINDAAQFASERE